MISLMEVVIGPWPWSLFNVVSGTIWIAGIAIAWKSADNVVRQNRPWTRAWRLTVIGFAFTVNGICLPLGASWIVVRYGPEVARRAARNRSLRAQAHP